MRARLRTEKHGRSWSSRVASAALCVLLLVALVSPVASATEEARDEAAAPVYAQQRHLRALRRVCGLGPAVPVRLTGTQPVLRWAVGRGAVTRTAWTSLDQQRVNVESCGTPTNRIRVPVLHAAVDRKVLRGWRADATYISCGALGRRPIDEVRAGGFFTCTAYHFAAWIGFISVHVRHGTPPYRIRLAE